MADHRLHRLGLHPRIGARVEEAVVEEPLVEEADFAAMFLPEPSVELPEEVQPEASADLAAEPIAAVAGILMGDYSDRVSVAVGTYNSDIEAKIAQIKRACRM